jgi:hypothetical protein
MVAQYYGLLSMSSAPVGKLRRSSPAFDAYVRALPEVPVLVIDDHGLYFLRGEGNLIMRTVAHIDSRGVWMNHFQTWVFRLQPSCEPLPGLSVSPQLFLRPHLCSPR